MVRPIVIKVGGALVGSADLLAPLWDAVRTLRESAPVLIVHGGGPQATALARQLGHEPRIVHGRRVTTDLDLSIIQWTLRGELNTRLVAQAVRHGLPAVGLSGVDGGSLRVHKRPPWVMDGEEVDFGWVGDIDRLETNLLEYLLERSFVPVFAPLGSDGEGNVYNVNADTVACTLAAAFSAVQFLLVTETGGVQKEVGQPASRLSRIDERLFQEGVGTGWIGGGMRVKLNVAFDARRGGIPEVYILAPDDILTRERGTRVI